MASVYFFILFLQFLFKYGEAGHHCVCVSVRTGMLHSNPGDYAWGQGGLDAVITQVAEQGLCVHVTWSVALCKQADHPSLSLTVIGSVWEHGSSSCWERENFLPPHCYHHSGTHWLVSPLSSLFFEALIVVSSGLSEAQCVISVMM